VNTNTKSNAGKVAYELWEGRGRPHGSAEQDWLAAERLTGHPKPQSASRSHKVEEGAT
jgi:hypothetical protein